MATEGRKKRDAQRVLSNELATLVPRLIAAGLPKTADFAQDAVNAIGWEMSEQMSAERAAERAALKD